jgi:choice-of-anchor C domain-containing protein
MSWTEGHIMRSAAPARNRLIAPLCTIALVVVNLMTAAPAAASSNATTLGTTLGTTFETPVVAPGTFQLFTIGRQIGPWTVTQGDVHLIGAGFWEAADGVQSLDLDGSVNGGIARDFDTLPLLTYRVSYSVAGNWQGAPVVKTGDVRVNGVVRQQFTFDTTAATNADMNYARKTFLFLATGFSTELEFVSTVAPQGYGAVIDDVDIQPCLLPILC